MLQSLKASGFSQGIYADDGSLREMAVGNTFGATALSSYGGFWISFGIILTPGGFEIESQLAAVGANAFYDEFGLYLIVRTLSLHSITPNFGF